MRVLLTGVLTALTFHTASAQTVLKREPHYLAAGAVAFVGDGRCTRGMVMKVTGRLKNGPRRKSCVSLSTLPARVMPRPEVASAYRSNGSTISPVTLSLATRVTVTKE